MEKVTGKRLPLIDTFSKLIRSRLLVSDHRPHFAL